MNLIPNISLSKGHRVIKKIIGRSYEAKDNFFNATGIDAILGVDLDGHHVVLYLLQDTNNEYMRTIYYRMLYDEEVNTEPMHNVQFYATGQYYNTRRTHVFAKIV